MRENGKRRVQEPKTWDRLLAVVKRYFGMENGRWAAISRMAAYHSGRKRDPRSKDEAYLLLLTFAKERKLIDWSPGPDGVPTIDFSLPGAEDRRWKPSRSSRKRARAMRLKKTHEDAGMLGG